MASDVARETVEILDCGCINLVDHVVIEEQPEAMWLDDADVVTAVGVGSAMDDDGHEIVHSIGIDCIVGLKSQFSD